MSYRAGLFVDGKWTSDGLLFATAEETTRYAKALQRVFLFIREYRVVESTEKPNRRFIGPGSHDIEQI